MWHKLLKKRGGYRVLVGKYEGNRPFGRLRHNRGIIVLLMWIDLAQHRDNLGTLVNEVLNLRSQ
jgi:hypothetical protein